MCSEPEQSLSVTQMRQVMKWPILLTSRSITRMVIYYKVVHHHIALPLADYLTQGQNNERKMRTVIANLNCSHLNRYLQIQLLPQSSQILEYTTCPICPQTTSKNTQEQSAGNTR